MRLGYKPGLDGVRGAAVLAVLLLHTFELAGGPDWFSGGYVGVDVFFVLSGFLITGIVASACSEPGWLRRFYERRVRRLMPASFTLLAVVAATGATVGLVTCLVYVQNFAIASGQVFPSALRHTWSLAIEEQFYLVWPVTLAAVVRWPRRVAAVLVALAVLVVAWRMWVFTYDPYGAWRRTDTKLDGLLAGCALALIPSLWARIGRWRHLAWCGFGAVMVAARFASDTALIGPVGLLVDIFAVGMVAGGTEPGGFGEQRMLRWFGRYSYGLYLWHYPILLWARSWWAVPVYVVVSVLSWHLIERRFLTSSPRSGSRSALK